MTPILERDLPDNNPHKFVRLKETIAYDSLANDHSHIAASHDLFTEFDASGKPIVSDAGTIQQDLSGKIIPSDFSYSCKLIGDKIRARRETKRIIASRRQG